MMSFDDVLKATTAYADGFVDSGMAGTAARGLAVLTCIDSRIDPLKILGLEPGDAKIIRNAGARVTDDALRSLVVAHNLLGANRICVVIHSDCAMAETTEDAVRLKIEGVTGVNAGAMKFLPAQEQIETLRSDLDRIRNSPLLANVTDLGGFQFNVRTGELHQVL